MTTTIVRSIAPLNDENLACALEEFSLKERISFRLVCSRWNRIIGDAIIWKKELKLYLECMKDIYASEISWKYALRERGDMGNSNEILRFAVERDLIARGLDLGRSKTTVTTVIDEIDIKTMELSPGGLWLFTASSKCVTVWKTDGLARLATRWFDTKSIVSDWVWNQSDGSLIVLIRPKNSTNLPIYVTAYKISLFPHDSEKSFEFIRAVRAIDLDGVDTLTLVNKSAIVVIRLDAQNRIACARYSLTELTLDSFLLENNLTFNLHDLTNRTVFTDSGHIAHASITGFSLWLLDQSGIGHTVPVTYLAWPEPPRSIYISKFHNLLDVSRITCNVVNNQGQYIYREIGLRNEAGEWCHTYCDTVVTGATEDQTRMEPGRTIFGQRVQEVENQADITWDTIVSIVPIDEDGESANTGRIIVRWPNGLKVDFDAAARVFVTLTRRSLLKGTKITSGFVL